MDGTLLSLIFLPCQLLNSIFLAHMMGFSDSLHLRTQIPWKLWLGGCGRGRGSTCRWEPQYFLCYLSRVEQLLWNRFTFFQSALFMVLWPERVGFWGVFCGLHLLVFLGYQLLQLQVLKSEVKVLVTQLWPSLCEYKGKKENSRKSLPCHSLCPEVS